VSFDIKDPSKCHSLHKIYATFNTLHYCSILMECNLKRGKDNRSIDIRSIDNTLWMINVSVDLELNDSQNVSVDLEHNDSQNARFCDLYV